MSLIKKQKKAINMNNLFNIKDYVVVITGGTGILGRCIAKYLALEGAKVIILGRKEEVGKKIVDDIVAEGGHSAQCSRRKHAGSYNRTGGQLLQPEG